MNIQMTFTFELFEHRIQLFFLYITDWLILYLKNLYLTKESGQLSTFFKARQTNLSFLPFFRNDNKWNKPPSLVNGTNKWTISWKQFRQSCCLNPYPVLLNFISCPPKSIRQSIQQHMNIQMAFTFNYLSIEFNSFFSWNPNLSFL